MPLVKNAYLWRRPCGVCSADQWLPCARRQHSTGAMDGIAVHAEDTFNASARTPLRLKIGTQAHWINTASPACWL